MVTHATRVAVIGGGLGGLTAAIALTRIAGVQVTVFEQAGQLVKWAQASRSPRMASADSTISVCLMRSSSQVRQRTGLV